MNDALPMSLIIFLSLSVFGVPGLYLVEGFLHGFTLCTALAATILCFTLLNLIIVLCITKNIKILLIFLSIDTGL